MLNAAGPCGGFEETYGPGYRPIIICRVWIAKAQPELIAGHEACGLRELDSVEESTVESAIRMYDLQVGAHGGGGGGAGARPTRCALLGVLEICEADDELRWEPVTRGASDEIVERFPS